MHGLSVSAFVGSQTKMSLCEKVGRSPVPSPLSPAGNLWGWGWGTRNRANGWVGGVGVAWQMRRREMPEEVGAVGVHG